MFNCTCCHKDKSCKIYKNGECHDCYMGNRKLTCLVCKGQHSQRWYKGPLCSNCYIKKNKNLLKETHRKCKDCGIDLIRKDNKYRCSKCYSKSIRDTPKARYGRALYTSKTRKLEFSIPKELYFELVIQNCYYCENNRPSSGVGLDRIDNKIGYTLSNVLPCCGECNNIRNNYLTVDETKFIITKLKEYRNEKNKT